MIKYESSAYIFLIVGWRSVLSHSWPPMFRIDLCLLYVSL